MTGLFTPTIRENRVGQGNGNFLADLAEHVPDGVMRARFQAGEYDPIHLPSIAGWRRMVGRTTEGKSK